MRTFLERVTRHAFGRESETSGPVRCGVARPARSAESRVCRSLLFLFGILLLCVTESRSILAALPQDAVFRVRDARTGRVSSWDKTGGNHDFVTLAPGETKELLALEGPGCITHFYCSPAGSPTLLRNAIVRAYWDDEPNPSIEVPLGDFFATGDCNVRLFASHYIVVNHGSGTIGYNAYFPMPFGKRARITLENDDSKPIGAFWYHIEYEQYSEPLPPDTGYFHAQWRRESPTRVCRKGPEAVPDKRVNKTLWEKKNVTGAENYVILEAEGKGHIVGLFLTCHNLAGGWWGEGDDMIFIDGREWPPAYHGTGTEEIFGGGACPNKEYAGPYTGFVAIHEQGASNWTGQNSMYRWYVHDPIRFQKSIRWTIEHGHANNFENDYSSVAYWYQLEPHKRFPKLPDNRLPPGGVNVPPPAPAIEGVLDAELLLDKVKTTLGDAAIVPPGKQYSRGEVVLFAARKPKASIMFTVTPPLVGRVQIGARFARGDEMGRYQLYVDDKPLGQPIDLFNNEGGAWGKHVLPTGDIMFGTVDLESGPHKLKFLCAGKNEKSHGFLLALDGFIFRE